MQKFKPVTCLVRQLSSPTTSSLIPQLSCVSVSFSTSSSYSYSSLSVLRSQSIASNISYFNSLVSEVSKNQINLEVKQPTVGDQRSFKFKDPTPPLVLLFGWAGSSHRNVSKYSDIYRNMGCTTAQFILPTKYIFNHTAMVPELMRSFLEKLEDLEAFEDRPLYIHCLSDTGLMCYQGLTIEDKRRSKEEPDKEKLNIKAVVFDSCPGPYPEITVRDVAKFLLVNFYCCMRDKIGLSASLSSSYRLLVDRAWPNYVRRMMGLEVELSKMEGVWCGLFGQDHSKLFPDRHELFLYSNRDFYLPSKFLEMEVLAKRSNRGHLSSSVKFSSSHHVQHLRVHRSQYQGAVGSFVRQTVEGPREEEQIEEQRKEERVRLPSYMERRDNRPRETPQGLSFGN